jgi:Outer membrane protein beta-barrel domain
VVRRWILVTLWPVILVPVATLGAQRPIAIGIAGGVSVPHGDLRDGVNTGWQALATVALNTPMQPLGLRLDVAYDRFAFSDRVRTAVGSGNQTVGSATLNVTYRLPMTNSPMSPYLISGLGAYRTACSLGPGCDGATHYGWNVGLGSKLRVLGVKTFIEARYHRTGRGDSDVHFFPVTFGLLF